MQLLKENLANPVKRKTMKGGGTTRGSARYHEDDEEEEKPQPKKKINWKKENPLAPVPRKVRTPTDQPDWLQKRRIKRQEKDQDADKNGDSKPYQDAYDSWKKNLRGDMTNKEKYEMIKDKAKVLEENALMKEAVLKAQSGGSLKETDQVNDMIFESIKAKLSILEEINT